MQTTTSNFVPFIQGVTWKEIEEGCPEIHSIMTELYLRYLILDNNDTLELLHRIFEKSPLRFFGSIPRREFRLEDVSWCTRVEPTLESWFRLLDYIEYTEPSTIASVLGNPPEIQVETPGISRTASSHRIQQLLINKSPWPEARWLKIVWGPEIKIRIFSEHGLPELPFLKRQTGVTYLLCLGGTLFDEINLPSRPRGTYASAP